MIFWCPPASDPADLPWQRWSDEDLVAYFRSRNGTPAGRAAVAELLGRYRSVVYQWCRGYAREREDALDLAQEVLVDAYRGLDGFVGQARFSSWLFAVARNRCLSAARRRRPETADAQVLEHLPAPGPPPDAGLEGEQRRATLRRIMRGHLSEREEEAVWLRVIECMSVDRITAVLGLENATGARSMLQNARRKLRRALGDRDDPFGEED